MANEVYGRGSAFGHGTESTYGTNVSRTNWLQLYSCTLQERPERDVIDHLSNGEVDFADEYDVRVACNGDLSMPFLFQGFGRVLQTAMGAAPTGSGPFTYERGTGFTSKALSVELIRGTSGQSEVFNGVVFPSWSLIFERNAVARFDAQILGQKANAARASAATASYGGTVQNRCAIGHHVGALTFNGTAHTCQRIEIAVNNNLSTLDELGSLYTSEPGQERYGEVTINATIVQRAETLYTELRSGASSNITFTITRGASAALAVTARNCVLQSAPNEIRGSGLVLLECSWRAKATIGGDGALTLVMTTGQTNFSDN